MMKLRKPPKANYFVMPNECIELFAARKIRTTDVSVFAALCSQRHNFQGVCVNQFGKSTYGNTRIMCNGVQVAQSILANMAGVVSKTVQSSIERLCTVGLIIDVIPGEKPKKSAPHIKPVNIYRLKPLSTSGFFFAPRSVFMHSRSVYEGSLKTRDLTAFFFMCMAQSQEYGKSWNSYNDICARLGYSKNQRSRVIKMIDKLVAVGTLNKKVRKINGKFADNIYRVSGIGQATNNGNAPKQRKRKVAPPRATNQKTSKTKVVEPNKLIISRTCQNVNRFFKYFLCKRGGVRFYLYNINQIGGVPPDSAELKRGMTRRRAVEFGETFVVRDKCDFLRRKESKPCESYPF
jgi:hypothetical protein